MFKKILYIVIVLMIGQFVLSFNIASARSEKRIELEEQAIGGEQKDFEYILKNINGKYIAAEKAYYNLEPVFEYQNDSLAIRFFEIYTELKYNGEDIKDNVLYIVITDISETVKKMETEKDQSSLKLVFTGEKQIEEPYALQMKSYSQSYYELIFSLKKVVEEEYGSSIADLEITDPAGNKIFDLSEVLPAEFAGGIDMTKFTGEKIKTDVETNENYGLCLTQTEHYNSLSYDEKIGKIIRNMVIYVVIIVVIAFLIFKPKKNHSAAYSNYKPANYRNTYDPNKKKTPSQLAYEEQLRNENNTIEAEAVEETTVEEPVQEEVTE